jgi:hypothetical protein
MRRDGCDEENLKPQDFLCDFCLNHWAEDRPMVEGHRGSLICSRCLTEAYRTVIRENTGETVPSMINCTLCVAHHDTPHWKGLAGPVACKRCIEQSARILEKDPDAGWKRP